jgi:acyl-CoA thioesterase FadM
MVLVFRFILVMLLSRFRPRIHPLGVSTLRFTVLPTDCDLNMHLNAGRFISFMDVSRVELLGRLRLFRKVIGMGWRPVVGGMRIRYRRSILPFHRFTVRSRVLGWDEKWCYFEHVMETKEGLCAIAHVRGLFRDGDRSVPPREFIALTGLDLLESPPLPPEVERWRQAEDAG